MKSEILSRTARGLICGLACAAFLSGNLAAAEKTRTVSFYDGQTVTVPEHVTRVATAWEAMNSILTMLGAGDNIVATTRVAQSVPLFRKYVPSITHAALTTMGGPAGLNVETILKVHPDILFIAGNLPPQAKSAFDAAHIATAHFHGQSIDDVVYRTLIVGKILGPEAYKKALAYQAYFERNKKLIADRLKAVPADKRVKLFMSSGMPLKTSGRPSLDQDWMDYAGAKNIAEGWKMAKTQGHASFAPNVSLESVIAANPDVIIVMEPRDMQLILHDPRWQNIKAVREHRVYANPRGIFWWSRETSEEAIQILWAAKTLYPDQFRDIDMVAETRDFYGKMYGMHLSDAEIHDILYPKQSVHGDYSHGPGEHGGAAGWGSHASTH